MDYRERIENNETQTSCWLPRMLWGRAKACASLMGLSLQDWLAATITAAVERQEKASHEDLTRAGGAVRAGGDRVVRRSSGSRSSRVRQPALMPALEVTPRQTDPLHGLPEAMGTSDDFPMTGRSEYLGQPRTGPLPTTTTCPKCGCAASCHRAGSHGNRCENHPPCMWVGIPKDPS